jgi:hypothetical protein
MKAVRAPGLVEHVGRTFTLPDGSWLVLQFSNAGHPVERFCVLPNPYEV